MTRLAPLLLALALPVACTPEPPDPLERALLHTAREGDSLGSLATEVDVEALAARAGLPVADAPSLIVTARPRAGAALGSAWPPPPADTPRYAPPSYGWTRLWSDATRALWRRATPVAAPEVAVLAEGLPGAPTDPPEHSPVRGFVVHGPAAPGGELVTTTFLQPPARMPLQACVSLDLGGRRLSLGTLLDGRGGFVPGAGPRPTVRHRALVQLPDGVAAGEQGATLHLHTCGPLVPSGSERDLSPPTPLRLTIAPSGRPSVEELQARVGTPDPDAEWATPRGRRTGLRRGVDGSIEVVPAPPLPRVLRGEAWGLVVTPPLDPTGFGLPDDTVGPLDPLRSLFEEADAALVHWDAAADREGASPEDRPVVRVVPEVMGHLSALDVQGVVLGDDAWLVGGGQGTERTAQALGLARGALDVGEDETAVGVAVVSLMDPATLGEDVAAMRAIVGEDRLLLGVVEGPVPDPLSAAEDLLTSGVDAGWVVAADVGPVLIRDGVPVLAGVPPMRGPSGRTLAMRWYVSPSGVSRVDLLGLESAGGRWDLVDDAAMKPDFEQLAAMSAPFGTRVAVGQDVAAVDVRAHGPDPDRPPARPEGTPVPEATGLPAPTQPARCAGGPPKGEPVAIGEDLELLEARVRSGEVRPGEPVFVELAWRARAPLPAGAVQWYVAGLGGAWRASTVPCDGMWGFEHFEPGVVVRETVRIWAPAGVEAGEGTLQLGVRLGEERLSIDGERFLDVGPVRVKGAPG